MLNKIINIIEIKRIMKEKRISKRRLVNELGFMNIGSLARYIKWVRIIKTNKTYDRLLKISNLLGVNIDDITLDNNEDNREYILEATNKNKIRGIVND